MKINLLTTCLALAVASIPSVWAADDLAPGLVGEYFQLSESIEDFPKLDAGRMPTLKRIDGTVNFESTQEAFPGTSMVDHFYVRWTGKIRISKAAKYTFSIESDDGSRLFIDGKQVVDNGGLHAMEEKSGEVELKPGDHEIKIEFFEGEVDAGCKFSWQTDGTEKKIVPAAVLFHDKNTEKTAAAVEGQGSGLLGEYFDIGSALEDFPTIDSTKKPVLKRMDKIIKFESTQEAFPGTTLVDHFYIRWTGKIQIPKDGKYAFYLSSDDGSRLFIDGKQVVDHGGLHAMEEKSGEADLKSGPHDIRIEYFENDVDGGCIFSWQPPGGEKVVVPTGVLSN
ncbi:MAG: hypothetical protein H7X97_12745 [Opitutaceae bacterium]|nr:hypothetical protein [Verrucomicrobiales bacterium]